MSGWIINGKTAAGWRIDPLDPRGKSGLDFLMNPIAIVPEETNARLIAAAPGMLAALKEIAKGEGAFSTDRLTHANNTIENMMALAEQAIADAEEARKSPMHPCDVELPEGGKGATK